MGGSQSARRDVNTALRIFLTENITETSKLILATAIVILKAAGHKTEAADRGSPQWRGRGRLATKISEAQKNVSWLTEEQKGVTRDRSWIKRGATRKP